MITWQIFLCSTVVAALISGTFQFAMKIYDNKQKKKNDIEFDQKSLNKELLSQLKTITEALQLSIRTTLRQECRKHISNNSITIDEREDLNNLHAAYHSLGGNGALNNDIKTINNDINVIG